MPTAIKITSLKLQAKDNSSENEMLLDEIVFLRAELIPFSMIGEIPF